MRCLFKSNNVMFAAVGLVAIGSVAVMAQSGSRNYPPAGSSVKTAPPAGSEQRAPRQAPVALEGYCPVSVVEMKKWVKGVPAYHAVYDGRTYLFANEKGKQMFEASPAKYVPALGGDCVVALVKMGKRIPGSIHRSAFHDGRLFLFSDEDGKKMFLADPATYAKADLALDGQCPVCRVNMGQSVPGKPEIAAFYKGFRYLFPADGQRRMFLESPEKYVLEAGGGRSTQTGSTARPPAGSGSGSR